MKDDEWLDALRLLGLHRRPAVTAEDIKAAYGRALERSHPDQGGDPFLWSRIQRAYDDLRSADDAGSSGTYGRQGSQWLTQEAQDAGEEWEGEEYEADDGTWSIWYGPLEPFCLHAALGLPKTNPEEDEARPAAAAARVRAAYHAIVARCCPGEQHEYATGESFAKAVVDFRCAPSMLATSPPPQQCEPTLSLLLWPPTLPTPTLAATGGDANYVRDVKRSSAARSITREI